MVWEGLVRILAASSGVLAVHKVQRRVGDLSDTLRLSVLKEAVFAR